MRMWLSFPGQGARAVVLLTWGWLLPPGAGRGPAGMGGQSSCGQGLLGSACSSWDPERRRSGESGGAEVWDGAGWGGGKASSPLGRVRCPVLACQGRNKERMRGRMMPHVPGSPNPGIPLLLIIFVDLLFIVLHKCSGFHRQTKPAGDALRHNIPINSSDSSQALPGLPHLAPSNTGKGMGTFPSFTDKEWGPQQPGDPSSAPLAPNQGDAVESWVGKSPIKIKSH